MYVGIFYHFIHVTGVCLTIPEGALEEGSGEDIFVAVCREDRDRPRLAGQYYVTSLRSHTI